MRVNKGRFLEKDEETGLWFEQSDERTLAKIGQLLREGKSIAGILEKSLLPGKPTTTVKENGTAKKTAPSLPPRKRWLYES